MPKVVLIGTGGTIASRFDPAQGRSVPSQSVEQLVAALPELAEIEELELDNFATLPSFDFSLEFAFSLTRRVNETLARDDVSGVVVTQGTDTLEETSYLTDLLLAGDKPAVFTGAQRAHDEPMPDGPGNILDAVRVAAAPQARGLGAIVCFAGQIHAARDVTKAHASALAAFQSYDYGALGSVDCGRVAIHRRPLLRRCFEVEQLEERVHLVRLSMGCDMRIVDAAVSADSAALVIEAFGRGNGPSELIAPIRRAREHGILVVVTSSAPAGSVQPIYGGGGGGRDLEDEGVIFAGDLKGPKVRTLLMVLLGSGADRDQVAATIRELTNHQ